MPNFFDDNPNRVLDTPQAATFLTFSKSWLDKARLRGDGPPFVRLGEGPSARVGYRLCDLQAWLETRVRRSTSDIEGLQR